MRQWRICLFFLEAVAMMLTVVSLCRTKDQMVLLHCDNEAVCVRWERHWSKCRGISRVFRLVELHLAAFNCVLHLKHVRTADNVVSDTISRHRVLQAGGVVLSDLARILSCSALCKVPPARSGMRLLRRLTQLVVRED